MCAGVAVLGLVLWNVPKQVRAQKERQLEEKHRQAAQRRDQTFKSAVAMLSGQSATQDNSQAYALLLQIGREGHLEAQCAIGNLLLTGNGVPQDKQSAFCWFSLAASNGHAQAQSNLGLMCLLGDGVSRDPKVGFYWLNKSAEQNNTNALMNLGIAYRDGAGVAKDIAVANKWFERAAVTGCAEGAHALGDYYAGGGKPDEAKKWYTEAAEGGYRKPHATDQRLVITA